MSDISPDARRVLTMLSPSVPPGRVSTLIVTFEWIAVYAAMSALVVALVFDESSVSMDSVTAAPLAAGAVIACACPPDGALVACADCPDVADPPPNPGPLHAVSTSKLVENKT